MKREVRASLFCFTYKKSVLEYEDVQKAVQYARELGREEGCEEGRELGREEGIRQLVRNMLAKGLDPNLVAEISGMTETEVNALDIRAD